MSSVQARSRSSNTNHQGAAKKKKSTVHTSPYPPNCSPEGYESRVRSVRHESGGKLVAAAEMLRIIS